MKRNRCEVICYCTRQATFIHFITTCILFKPFLEPIEVGKVLRPFTDDVIAQVAYIGMSKPVSFIVWILNDLMLDRYGRVNRQYLLDHGMVEKI